MDPYTIVDVSGYTELGIAPAGDKTLLTVVDRTGLYHSSVLLESAWLLPLAAWFAGEAETAALGEDPLLPYARRLAIDSDSLALVYSTHTEARLRCARPFGRAWVTIGPRGRMSGAFTASLSPGMRTDVATWLRRAGAENRVRPIAAV
jgi:hypothetical protein